MTDATENLVLEHLPAIRADVSSIKDSMDDLKARMSSLETAMVTVKHEVANGDDVDARQQVSLDKILKRIERIERRLEIAS